MAVEEFANKINFHDFTIKSLDFPVKFEKEGTHIQSKIEDKSCPHNSLDVANQNIANKGLHIDFNEGPSCSSTSSQLEDASTSVGTKLKKQVKRLSRSQLEAQLTRKVVKLMKSETKLGQLQRDFMSLQQEVRVWKERSNTLAKSCKNVAEAVKETVIKPQNNPQVKTCVRSVNIQVGASTLVKEQLKVVKAKEHEVDKVNISILSHPAPLPTVVLINDSEHSSATLPPKLKLQVSSKSEGIQLCWTLDDTAKLHTEVQVYEIYAYLETSKPPSVNFWKKVGDVKAIPLPIRCTLSQFKKGSKYHFSVRARDANSHFGHFSEIKSVIL